MLSLGYRRYAIQGGDWGAALARHMCRLFPSNVAALHLNFCPSAPPLLNPPLVSWIFKLIPSPIYSIACALTPSFLSQTIQTVREYPRWKSRITYTKDPTIWTTLGHALLGLPAPLNFQDRAKVVKSIEFMSSGSAYAAMQGTKPSTLALVLQSDPGALLAWIAEKMYAWTDEE
jgi:pimeloyl-ACP methyl ester carboxylesterase